MHLRAGHAGKHLHRAGEVELGDFRKNQETDLKRSRHGESLPHRLTKLRLTEGSWHDRLMSEMANFPHFGT
jgi:hypothetical protein